MAEKCWPAGVPKVVSGLQFKGCFKKAHDRSAQAGLLFLRNSADIERVKKTGRRLQTPLFSLVYSPSGLASTRVGIIVSKRFGKAVARNRAKRIFRELTRQSRGQLVNGQDMLIFPRREALRIRHDQLLEAWATALKHEGLLHCQLSLQCNDSAWV
ncbi:MAG: ribonuclease P protein component [Nitrospiraceae bacterium]